MPGSLSIRSTALHLHWSLGFVPTSSPSSVVWCISQTVPMKHCSSFLILLLNTSSFPQRQSCNNSLAPKGLITLKSARTSWKSNILYYTGHLTHNSVICVRTKQVNWKYLKWRLYFCIWFSKVFPIPQLYFTKLRTLYSFWLLIWFLQILSLCITT